MSYNARPLTDYTTAAFMRDKGKTYAEIGRTYGVSRACAAQMVKRGRYIRTPEGFQKMMDREQRREQRFERIKAARVEHIAHMELGRMFKRAAMQFKPLESALLGL
jgi:hypothetical protein